jgi:single-stranded-DNA-specific exonuclease
LKYKLINEELSNKRSILSENISDIVLKNRGIEYPNEYLSLDDSRIQSYKLLNNIDLAVSCLLHHVEKKSDIKILVDGDP